MDTLGVDVGVVDMVGSSELLFLLPFNTLLLPLVIGWFAGEARLRYDSPFFRTFVFVYVAVASPTTV